MTPIRYSNPPRWRQSEVLIRDRGTRLLTVALEPSALLLRLKGTRQVLRYPLSLAYDRAAWLETDRLRRERQASRQAKRKGGGR